VFAAIAGAPLLLVLSLLDGSTQATITIPHWGVDWVVDYARMVVGPDSNVYLCSASFQRGTLNPVVAISVATQSTLWQSSVLASPPCVMDASGQLYVAGVDQVIALSAATGAQAWAAPTVAGAGVSSLSLGLAGQLYALAGNGTLLSIGAAPQPAFAVTTRDASAAGVGAGVTFLLCGVAFGVWWFRCRGKPGSVEEHIKQVQDAASRGAASLTGFYSPPQEKPAAYSLIDNAAPSGLA
jgi:hypothetical protein